MASLNSSFNFLDSSFLSRSSELCCSFNFSISTFMKCISSICFCLSSSISRSRFAIYSNKLAFASSVSSSYSLTKSSFSLFLSTSWFSRSFIFSSSSSCFTWWVYNWASILLTVKLNSSCNFSLFSFSSRCYCLCISAFSCNSSVNKSFWLSENIVVFILSISMSYSPS